MHRNTVHTSRRNSEHLSEQQAGPAGATLSFSALTHTFHTICNRFIVLVIAIALGTLLECESQTSLLCSIVPKSTAGGEVASLHVVLPRYYAQLSAKITSTAQRGSSSNSDGGAKSIAVDLPVQHGAGVPACSCQVPAAATFTSHVPAVTNQHRQQYQSRLT